MDALHNVMASGRYITLAKIAVSSNEFFFGALRMLR